MSNNTIRRRTLFFFISLLGAAYLLSCSQVDKSMGAFVFRDVVAYAGADQRRLQYLPIDLDGSGSKSPEGQSLTYHWNQIAGPETEIRRADTARAAVTPSELGEYVFELTATDPAGTVSTDQVTLSIVPAMGIGSDYVMADALPSSVDPLADLFVSYVLASDLDTHSDDRVQFEMINNVIHGGDQLPLHALYLAPVSADYWGINLLANSSFDWGQSLSWEVVSGDYDLRALDSRGSEYYARIGLAPSMDLWQINSGSAISESPGLARARSLIGRMRLGFIHNEVEYVFAYELQPFVHWNSANTAFEVRGASQSDNAPVVAVFDPSAGLYRLTHTYSSDKQYRYLFEIRGDQVHGAIELRYRNSETDAWDVIDVAPLSPVSRLVNRKIRK